MPEVPIATSPDASAATGAVSVAPCSFTVAALPIAGAVAGGSPPAMSRPAASTTAPFWMVAEFAAAKPAVPDTSIVIASLRDTATI